LTQGFWHFRIEAHSTTATVVRLVPEQADAGVHKRANAVENDEDEMSVEVSVVSAADTVVNPRAVMIVALNAAIANVAVAALRQSNHSAERA